jgi:hypothetical protein
VVDHSIPESAPLRCCSSVNAAPMMTEHRERVLRIERTFDAPVERVLEA